MTVDVARWNEFAEAAYLNKKHHPWVRRKQPGNVYADIIIVSCQRPDWWYKDFIGIECFAELRYNIYPFDPTVAYLREAIVVRLHGVLITSGRSIAANDFIIL